MTRARQLLATATLAGCAFALAFGLSSWRASPAAAPHEGEDPELGERPRRARDAPRTTPSRAGLRWIAAGGGSIPELNQIQLEQDLALASDVLGADGSEGLLLFAGGPGSNAVQRLVPAREPTLRSRLAALFDPRGGRDSTYQRTTLLPEGAASAEAILHALEGALRDGDAPLTLLLAGHGLGGESPADSRLLTWGPADLWVGDLANTLDPLADHRPLRLVVTSCFGGGFAELAFDAADPESGPATTDRCGLFATSWDRTASGCDPNPDRGAQEGYTIHFLHALRGEDRGAQPLAAIDLDGDGRISLLEAHTRARIASRSIDAPVTTSDVFLRAAVEPDDRAHPPFALPEEQAVIEALGAALEVHDERGASERLSELEAELTPLAERLDALDAEVETALVTLNSALVHRWPQLDDPWHPEFEGLLAREATRIEAFLDESAAASAYASLAEERDALADRHDERFLEIAMLERLSRAYETARLAAQLRAEGGTYWQRYQRFLACERGLP